MAPQTLTVAEALLQAEIIDRNLETFAETAPTAIAALGGRNALANLCEMTCIGPLPRFDAATWEAISREYQDRLDGWA